MTRFTLIKEPANGFQTEYHYWVRVNQPKDTWRQALAYLLRRLAEKIDGNISLGVDIISIPPLSDKQKQDAVRTGIKAIEKAVADEAKAEAFDSAFRFANPSFFTDQK